MEDREIIELFFRREESAITETAAKYGAYCRSLARNILGDMSSAEECVNDTLFRAWNTIPPSRPRDLRVFLAKLCRNLAFDRYRASRAQKRGGGETETILSELSDCIRAPETAETPLLANELNLAVSGFVRSLSRRDREIFLRRYFYAESVSEIARHCRMRANSVSVILSRLRRALRDYLQKEGLI